MLVFPAYSGGLRKLPPLDKKLTRGGCQNQLLTAYYEDISLEHKISKKSCPKAPAKPLFSLRIVRENFSALGGYKTPIFPAYSGGLFLQQKLSSFFKNGPCEMAIFAAYSEGLFNLS